MVRLPGSPAIREPPLLRFEWDLYRRESRLWVAALCDVAGASPSGHGLGFTWRKEGFRLFWKRKS